MINFNKLSKMQAELDLIISREKQLNHSDYTLEKIIALSVEFHELLQEKHTIFKYWSIKPNNHDAALTEFVDGVHFLISIANDYGIENYEYTRPADTDLRAIVLGISNMISRLYVSKDVKQLFDYYLLLAEKLDFTAEDIESAYLKKYQVNIDRAESGIY